MQGPVWLRFDGCGSYFAKDAMPEIHGRLPAGFYKLSRGMMGLAADPVAIGEERYRVPPLAGALIGEIEAFLGARETYRGLRMPYKRGFLLHGTPGCGKTSLIRAVVARYVAAGHLAFEVEPIMVDAYRRTLPKFREVEPDRPILTVIEDVDAIVGRGEETDLLAMLDGVDAACGSNFTIATTNYIERLPPRIRCRPSRFDRVEELGMPGREQREGYAAELAGVDAELAAAMADATDGLPYAGVKEVAVSVLVFGHDVLGAAERVRSMFEAGASVYAGDDD